MEVWGHKLRGKHEASNNKFSGKAPSPWWKMASHQGSHRTVIFVDHISIDFSSVYFEDFAPCALLYIYVCTFNAIWFLRRIYKRAAIEYSFSFISSSSLIYRSWRPIESLIIEKMEDGVVIFFLFLVLLNAMTRMKPWKV